MKIVYCVDGMYGFGGIERIVSSKMNWLVENGHDVTFLTTNQGGNSFDFPLDSRIKYENIGVNYEEDNVLHPLKRYFRAWYKSRGHLKKLEDALFRIKPDITITASRYTVPLLHQIKDGSKKVVEIHSSRYTKILQQPVSTPIRRMLGRFLIWWNDQSLKKYDRCVILTEEERGVFEHLGNVEVIPNMSPFATDKPSLCTGKKVLAAGRFAYQKNFKEMVDIWEMVHSEFPDWQLEIVGEGYLYPQVKEYVDTKGLSESILLPGASTQMPEKMRSASIYALTSHYEGLPMVLIEAQVMGLPIVSYKCPSGPSDIVSDSVDGFLIPKYDKECFADKLKKLMADESLRKNMGEAGISASKRFDKEVIMKRWETLFDCLMRR